MEPSPKNLLGFELNLPERNNAKRKVMFESKHINAVLRDTELRALLLNSASVPLENYLSFDQQSPEMQDEINENIDEILQAYAPFQARYSSPIEELPDDAWIYGTRGIYVVCTQDGCVLFTKKVEAVRYANEISKVSWEVARNEGLIDM